MKTDTSSVAIGEGLLVLRRRGRPAATAKILGSEAGADGVTRTIWLDRMLHEPGEETLGGHAVCGAVVTQIVVPIELCMQE
jgi:hypothetical protein